MATDTRYRNEAFLRYMYWDLEMSQCDMADYFGIDESTVGRQMKLNGIETRAKTQDSGHWRKRVNSDPEQ